jgi:chemotaxis protein CheX
MCNTGQFINPFVNGAFSVMSMMLGETPTRGPLAADASTSTSHQVNVVVGVTGDAHGSVILGMSLVTADRIASKMIGEPVRTFDGMAASAISELCNMICGTALGELSSQGLTCDLTPPSVIRGQKVQISNTVIPTIRVNLMSSLGCMTVSIALKRKVEQLAA